MMKAVTPRNPTTIFLLQGDRARRLSTLPTLRRVSTLDSALARRLVPSKLAEGTKQIEKLSDTQGSNRNSSRHSD